MSASLVGSEMCIRDRARPSGGVGFAGSKRTGPSLASATASKSAHWLRTCLLYTSDAADDM
eukprot:6892099-Alexandrium_andersonii.AAC.1